MNALGKRLSTLERTQPDAQPRWHRLTRYEGESEADAVAAYEAEHGPIGDDNIIMRVIINKPGERLSRRS